MKPNRVEALSDGMIAIIITVMVFQMEAPRGSTLNDLVEISPVFVAYILSFIMLGTYWSNHHHLFHAVKEVDANIMWGNLHLMFWLSLFPFVTHWVGVNVGEQWPAALYGIVQLGAGLAYTILQTAIVAHQGQDSVLAEAMGSNAKGKISVAGHILATVTAFFMPLISYLIFAFVALMWVVPDRRIEAIVKRRSI
jgi:uncharacterized membrane protein